MYSEYLSVNNVLSTDSNLQLNDFISNETDYLTSLFVGTATRIFSFNVFGNKRPITFTITYSTPLALSESSSVGLPTTGLRSTINSTSLTLYRNGVLVSTTSGTKTNTTDPKYNITSAGAYNYKQFVNIITGSITITDDYSGDTASFYELKMSINNTRAGSGGTYGYEANTLSTGITKSANVDNDETFTNYSAGAYTITVANQTPTYSTDSGTLINNSFVNNIIYNSQDITNLGDITNSGTITTNRLINTIMINKYINITTTPYTLLSTNSYYFIKKDSSPVEIILPNLSNFYTGFTVFMRTAPPTRNSDTIRITCASGVSFYHDNLTPTTGSENYNNSVAFHLVYGGSSDWFLLDTFLH